MTDTKAKLEASKKQIQTTKQDKETKVNDLRTKCENIAKEVGMVINVDPVGLKRFKLIV